MKKKSMHETTDSCFTATAATFFYTILYAGDNDCGGGE